MACFLDVKLYAFIQDKHHYTTTLPKEKLILVTTNNLVLWNTVWEEELVEEMEVYMIHLFKGYL